MKKILVIFLVLLCGLHGSPIWAQGQADIHMKQAQDCLDNKEYIKARALFLVAYKSFAASSQYEKATVCGVKATALYYRENYYKEAFDLLRSTDQMISQCEEASHRSRPDLRYSTVKERLLMYTKLKKVANAKEQLNRMEELAKSSGNDSLQNDLLYTQANTYYTFGMNEQGDKAISQLIGQYKDAKQYDKVIECYRTLISIARKSGNATLTSRSYEQYILWKDSVKVLKAQDELAALQKECNEKQNILDEKDSSLRGRMYIIVSLCTLAGLLAAALIIGGIILLRFIVLSRKQKKAIAIANENNEQKSSFIRNISSQMAPTLAKLDASHPSVKALKGFIAHIEEMSELESHLSEPCEMQEKNIATFCEGLAKQVESKVKEGVNVVVNAPKLSMSMNVEMLERLLLHLLDNAAYHTPEGGKISLEYKKRGAHTHQFIVSDNGCGIDAAKRDTLLKPFTQIKDLTEGDGLGLPICALLATRMNGSLKLDEEYTKGARFILELHT